ncbi:hypothetical protein [Taklimakanibacter lacteus]|uniref:hypothetical protein n=1 Tax=Taklimakanibacter lacteus TaxID=2268456 RepID=UPI0013C4695F
MLNIKTLAIATGISAGVALALPATSQAMPHSSPVKVDTIGNSNVVEVRHKKRWKRFARYCRRNWDDPRCHSRHRSARYHRYRYRYYEPYDDGYYRPYRPGIGLYLNID